MELDSSRVLANLVHSNIWSSSESLAKLKRIVVDVDSVVTYLYRLCISNHIRRQRSVTSGRQALDLYAVTLVNYVEFSNLIKRLFDFFVDHQIEPILVYNGKYMEAPLYGLIAAKFTRNTQNVSETLSMITEYNKNNIKLNQDFVHHVIRPNLALNIFKSIVNVRRRAGAKIRIYQAFYSSYPLMAKLARDFKCSALTNNCEFILMDVRGGFVLFEDLWVQHVDSHDSVPRDRSKSLQPDKKSPKSPIKSPARAKSLDSAPSKINFHYNQLFLLQHPGLNIATTMYLFPLTTIDFIVKYSKSLTKLNIYDREYYATDFAKLKHANEKQIYKKYQSSANRLDMVLRFMSTKNNRLLGNLVRGEATRLNIPFDDDFRQLFYYYAAAFEFKDRLRFTLKYVYDPVQLNYIEWCLTNRECTSDYLLVLLCCSIGHLAGVSYNNYLQLEDLATKRSAHALQNPGKSMLMSLFSANKSHKSENSVTKSISKNQETSTRYSTAALTVVDREGAKIVEQNLSTTHADAQLDALRDKLQFSHIARRQVNKQDSIKFINLVFGCSSLTHLPAKIEDPVKKLLGDDEHHILNELAIVRSLFQFCFTCASVEDSYFKSNYSKLSHHFEIGILNHYLYINESLAKKGKQNNLSGLLDIINKQDFENVANQIASELEAPRSKSPNSKKKSSSKASAQKSTLDQVKSSSRLISDASKHIRHLIELLSSSIETYCELNAFFDYPLPRLNLHLHYNPILIYNLTLFSQVHTNNKALFKP